MLNHATVMGRLTADPELRHTPSGVAVSSFRIAVERDFKDNSGKRGVDFIPIVCWRGTAEFATKYFAKGRMIVVDGRLRVREYTKDGDKRYTTEIVAENLYFGDSRKEETKPDPEWVSDENIDGDIEDTIPF